MRNCPRCHGPAYDVQANDGTEGGCCEDRDGCGWSGRTGRGRPVDAE